jgi:2-alkenal reductase
MAMRILHDGCWDRERMRQAMTERGRRIGAGIIVLLVTCFVALGGAPAALAQPQLHAQSHLHQIVAQNQEMTPVEVVERVAPAVVTVINKRMVGDLSGAGAGILQPAGAGTGFIIDDQGHIVTNAHVLAGGDQFEVIFADGEKRPASVVGADRVSDLAVVQVKGDVPGVVPFGDSDALKPGQTVLAIGSPLGALTNTVTQGIVSALGRNIGDSNYTDLIQHDAAINPGNSGGPLVNLTGEVVGVNTLGIDETPDGRIAQGLFFAIPSNTVKTITGQLIDHGEVTYPFFGISFQSVNEQLAAQLDLPVDYGILVGEVTAGGPAEAAGIESGDIILSIDGDKITPQTPFVTLLFKHAPGDTIEVVVQRGDQTFTTNITLGERPAGL